MYDPHQLWLQYLIVLFLALAVFLLFARKKLWRAFLLGLIPIILFTQIASVVFQASTGTFGDENFNNNWQETAEQKARHREGHQAFGLIYNYFFLGLLGYTGFTFSLWPVLRRVIGKGRIQSPELPLMFAGAVGLLVGLYWAISISGDFLYNENPTLLTPYLFLYLYFVVFIGGFLNYPIYQIGLIAVIVTDLVVLLLVVVYPWLERRMVTRYAQDPCLSELAGDEEEDR